MGELSAFDGGNLLAMGLLRSRVQRELHEMLAAAERNGADYIITAMSAVATLAEEQASLFACIPGPEDRRHMVDELHRRMLEAVEIRHSQVCREQCIGGSA